jgi:hypothetical protein
MVAASTQFNRLCVIQLSYKCSALLTLLQRHPKTRNPLFSSVGKLKKCTPIFFIFELTRKGTFHARENRGSGSVLPKARTAGVGVSLPLWEVVTQSLKSGLDKFVPI